MCVILSSSVMTEAKIFGDKFQRTFEISLFRLISTYRVQLSLFGIYHVPISCMWYLKRATQFCVVIKTGTSVLCGVQNMHRSVL